MTTKRRFPGPDGGVIGFDKAIRLRQIALHSHGPEMSGKMNCNHVAESLMDYLDDELPPRRRAAFEKHLAACPACVAGVKGYERSMAVTKAALAASGLDCRMPEELVCAILAHCA